MSRMTPRTTSPAAADERLRAELAPRESDHESTSSLGLPPGAVVLALPM